MKENDEMFPFYLKAKKKNKTLEATEIETHSIEVSVGSF